MKVRKIVSGMALCGGLLLSGEAAAETVTNIREYRHADLYYDTLAADIAEPEEDDGIDFAALREINPDVIAWIRLEGTEIDYPVVQGEDNEWYLEHLFTGETVHSACIFADYRSSPDLSDRYTFLYGHNMKDGTMFSCLENYRDDNYYAEHPFFQLFTPEDDYHLEVLNVILTDGSDPLYSLAEDMNAVSEKTVTGKEGALSVSDRLVILSTCRYDAEDGRLLVVCRLQKQ